MGDKILLNFGAKFQRWFEIFTCDITKLPWQPSVTGIKRRFKKPKHTKEHTKKDLNRYFVEKFST